MLGEVMWEALTKTSIILFSAWLQFHPILGAQSRPQRIWYPSQKTKVQHTEVNEPLSRIRYYFETRYNNLWAVNISRERWIDTQIKSFLDEIKTELDSLEIIYSSLGDESKSLQVSHQGLFNRDAASTLSAQVGKIQRQTKDLREKLSVTLSWSVRVEGFKLKPQPDRLKHFERAVRLLNQLFSAANMELRSWLFPEEYHDSSVITVQEASEDSPLVELLKSELVAAEIVLILNQTDGEHH